MKDLKHVAVIMDGNGRWARKRGLPHLQGHRQGAETLRAIIEESVALKLKFLTVFAFSTENWNRPRLEVQGLMALLKVYLRKELEAIHKQNVRFRIIGERNQLSSDIQKLIQEAEDLTAHNTGLTFIVALSYGSRQEITQAFKEMASEIRDGKMTIDDITPARISQHLYTKDFPDPDLLIRTSGEQRISNFLLWQCAYAEFYFTPTLWPDFSKEEFRQAFQDFEGRERRYGLTSQQLAT